MGPGDVRPVEDLADLVGDARFVLLGEATHGTHEFYAVRAELTRRLVAEHGFAGVAVEGDWPAADRADRYVRGAGEDPGPEEALGGFGRFPPWLWRNPVVVELVAWLRAHGRGAGFHGLDLLSLRASMSAVVEYLDAVDPPAAARARRRYACFEDLDERAYGEAAARGEKDPCEDAVVAQLEELRRRAPGDGDAGFAALQNARLATGAEGFYRAMYTGGSDAWNLRDAHMADTLDALHAHTDGGRLVVWAHNSHVGDARATEAAARGELSLGQIVRERHGDAVRLVGFTTHAGTVTAAREWGGPAEHRILRPSLEGSVERLLHDAGVRAGVLDLRRGALAGQRLSQRMVGVVYRPEAEIWNHYLTARPAEQFDAIVHLDTTTALEPLERWAATETCPSGL